MNKSALAFFFLFLLYGFSIGSGQQGISYNVPSLCVSGGLKKTDFPINN